MATSKQMLRLFMVGGVQQEVISLPGRVVTVVGWGGRLAVVYQTGLGNSYNVTLLIACMKLDQVSRFIYLGSLISRVDL